MICGRCGMWYSAGDNYCRRCGALVSGSAPAVPAERRLVQAARVVQAVPPVVWKGLIALAASKALEWGAKAAARRVVEAAPATISALIKGRVSGARQSLPVPSKPEGAPAGAIAETVVLMRRIQVLPGGGRSR